jgi:hypothetical protein
VKQAGHGIDHTPQYRIEVKERVELYLASPLWVFMVSLRVKFCLSTLILRIGIVKLQ